MPLWSVPTLTNVIAARVPEEGLLRFGIGRSASKADQSVVTLRSFQRRVFIASKPLISYSPPFLPSFCSRAVFSIRFFFRDHDRPPLHGLLASTNSVRKVYATWNRQSHLDLK